MDSIMSSPPDSGVSLVTVVLPVLNSADTLAQQLEALSRQTYRGAWEMVIVDNGSSDGSDLIARSWSDRLPSLRVVYALRRRGCSHARNVGARHARGEFIVTCDADDIVVPGWLEAMVEAGRYCDIVGGRLEQESLNSLRSKSWRPSFPSDELPVALGFLPYAIGANTGVRTEVFRALGGWNEDLAVCGDDVEFSWRAQLADYRVCFAPESVVRYRFRDQPRDIARQFFNYGRVEPRLYRLYRDRGLARSSTKKAIRDWVWIMLRVGDSFRSTEQRGAWLRRFSYRRGRLVGSMRERVLFL